MLNWKQIIEEIQLWGRLTQQQVAAECECGQATISGLIIGNTKQPRHALGEAILALHRKFAPTALAKTAQAATETVAGEAPSHA